MPPSRLGPELFIPSYSKSKLALPACPPDPDKEHVRFPQAEFATYIFPKDDMIYSTDGNLHGTDFVNNHTSRDAPTRFWRFLIILRFIWQSLPVAAVKA
jgi:hypothetical protein